MVISVCKVSLAPWRTSMSKLAVTSCARMYGCDNDGKDLAGCLVTLTSKDEHYIGCRRYQFVTQIFLRVQSVERAKLVAGRWCEISLPRRVRCICGWVDSRYSPLRNDVTRLRCRHRCHRRRRLSSAAVAASWSSSERHSRTISDSVIRLQNSTLLHDALREHRTSEPTIRAITTASWISQLALGTAWVNDQTIEDRVGEAKKTCCRWLLVNEWVGRLTEVKASSKKAKYTDVGR